MKILRIIARLNVGGPARHVIWLTEALNDAEFESTLVVGAVPDGEEDMAYFADKHAVKPVYIEEMSRELSVNDIVSLLKILRVIKFEQPDIIHTHTAKAGTLGRSAAFIYRWLTWKTLIGKPRKVRVVHTFHGHVFHSYYGKAKTKFFIVIEKLLARFATDKIITITRQQFREIHEQVGVGRQAQFEIIPLGIDLSAFEDLLSKREAVRNEVGAADDEILVGFVGRLTEIKNIPMLLQAAKLYLKTPDAPQARFLIVGDGHLRIELEKIAADFGISDRILFIGNRDDADTIYAGLDVIALTSLNEGTPLSLIEAMSCGRVIISTAVGGVVDLLGEVRLEMKGVSLCERGVSVRSNNAEDFAKGLIYLAKDEKLRKSLGERGREFVVANYRKDRLVKDMKALYRSLV